MRVRVYKDITGALFFTTAVYHGPLPEGWTFMGWAKIDLYDAQGTELVGSGL